MLVPCRSLCLAAVFSTTLVAGLRFPALRAAGVAFIRGDANASGAVDISDGIKVLNVLFLGDSKLDCDEAMDGNGDGSVDISDGVYVLGFLFTGGPSPPPPFPGCGPGPGQGSLTCIRHDICGSCLGPEEAAALLAASGACLAAGAPPFAIGPATVSVVPVDLARPCGPGGAPGWPIQLSLESASADLPGRSFRMHARGSIDDMPVRVQTLFGTTVCTGDIVLEGDLVLRFTAAESSGSLVLTRFDSVGILNATTSATASGGTLCDIGGSLAGFVQETLLDQMEAHLSAQLPVLNQEQGGRLICSGD